MATTTMEPAKKERSQNEQHAEDEIMELKEVAEAALCSFKKYARAKPEVVAMWCLGIGFVLGWKLKPW